MVERTREQKLLELGETSAEILHELRNMLVVISTTAYVARQKQPSPEIATIERNTHDAQRMIDDLLSLLREGPLPTDACNLHELCAEASASYTDRARVVLQVAPAFELRAHDRLFVRMLRILFENAVAVSRSKAQITLTAQASGKHDIVLTVADDGPGIPASIASSVFDPLVTARDGGTGLGLALARRIALAHGFILALEGSEQGACFSIRITHGVAP